MFFCQNKSVQFVLLLNELMLYYISVNIHPKIKSKTFFFEIVGVLLR